MWKAISFLHIIFHIQEFNGNYPEAIEVNAKYQILPLKLLVRSELEIFPKTGCWYCSSMPTRTWCHRTWRSQVHTVYEASCLLANLHSITRCFSRQLKAKDHQSLTQLWILKVTITTGMARYGHRCNSGSNAMGITTCFLTGLKVCSTGRKTHQIL